MWQRVSCVSYSSAMSMHISKVVLVMFRQHAYFQLGGNMYVRRTDIAACETTAWLIAHCYPNL